jgi:phospho-N-acetylmuramoyl-pentapeptide-transferase
MSPLHHHFQKLNIPESKITLRFWLVTIILVLIAIAMLKLR